MAYAANSRDRRIVALKPYRFQKGHRGKPAGMPQKDVNVAVLARNSATKAMEKLITLLDSEDERIALQASIAILDRTCGKPRQAVVELPGKDRRLIDYTIEELLEIAFPDRIVSGLEDDTVVRVL